MVLINLRVIFEEICSYNVDLCAVEQNEQPKEEEEDEEEEGLRYT